MIATILALVSHLFFIVMAHQLLVTVVDWSKWLNGTAENKGKIQLFLLFIAIALGYLVSTFFLDLLTLSRTLAVGLTD